jgi:hypothetical protein
VTDRFGSQSGEHPFAVLGDLNDYLEDDDQGSTGIAELVGWDQLENVVERLTEDERRAHFYPKRRAYHQLDYLLLSRARAEVTADPPEIMRKGAPLRRRSLHRRALHPRRPRQPKASDHRPWS